MRPLIDSDSQVTLTTAEWRTRVGLPARLTLSDPRTHDGTVKIPGMIRDVTTVGITVELFFPLVNPRLGATVILEVMAKAALLQASTSIYGSPSPQCVHLAFPDEVHRIERRQSLRVTVAASAVIKSATGGTPLRAVVTNLSTGGCAVTAEGALFVGAPVELDLQSTGLSPTHVKAQVVRCSLSATSPGQWEVGLAFYDMTDLQKRQLEGYMKLYE